ncbi:MAG: hypothetical protein KIT86_16330 [Hydrogenophaga sp.]|uniref:hypothetical protein n=1 Tax=Hydrogenophaga sp. TaxID=1904254 RepID=UPI002633C76B|nr:hypothetical protein [Hydrogenophaga sp.]MCW5671225.1 hypothetical protein [Hydrogenophaga sp.]
MFHRIADLALQLDARVADGVPRVVHGQGDLVALQQAGAGAAQGPAFAQVQRHLLDGVQGGDDAPRHPGRGHQRDHDQRQHGQGHLLHGAGHRAFELRARHAGEVGPALGRGVEVQGHGVTVERHRVHEAFAFGVQVGLEIGRGRSPAVDLATGVARDHAALAVDDGREPARRQVLLVDDALELVRQHGERQVEHRLAVAQDGLHQRGVGNAQARVLPQRQDHRAVQHRGLGACAQAGPGGQAGVDQHLVRVAQFQPAFEPGQRAPRLLVEIAQGGGREPGGCVKQAGTGQRAHHHGPLGELAVEHHGQGTCGFFKHVLAAFPLHAVGQAQHPGGRAERGQQHGEHQRDQARPDRETAGRQGARFLLRRKYGKHRRPGPRAPHCHRPHFPGALR